LALGDPSIEICDVVENSGSDLMVWRRLPLLKLQMLGSYLGPELVTEGKSAIFSGPSGTGKTHLCIAIAYRAIQHGYEARFVEADGLIATLSRAAEKRRLDAALEPFIHPHVLVIDELGYLNH